MKANKLLYIIIGTDIGEEKIEIDMMVAKELRLVLLDRDTKLLEKVVIPS